MATKYIVDNLTGQTITGDLTISGKTIIDSLVPTSVTGTTGDKAGTLSLDGEYLYYCNNDFVEPIPVSISGGTPTHIVDADPNSSWNTYGGDYLQIGAPQEVGLTPLAGWYIVDDNGVIRQILSDPVWFSGGAPTPIQNGPGWLLVLDGPYTYSVSNPTITLYETLPTVSGGSAGSGNIWRSVKLDKTFNTNRKYKALLTQTAPITATNITNFYDSFIIGETYTITNYVPGDDFSNIANVQSGVINESGCVFIATGQTPTNWINGSTLDSSGHLVVDVLENNLGYDILWEMNPFGGSGTYVGTNSNSGPIYNNFNRSNVSVITQLTSAGPPPLIQIVAGPGSYTNKDDVLFVGVWDFDIGTPVDNFLYYTPVEVQIKQDLDTTPITLSGSVVSSFPFSYASIDLICNGNYIENFVGDNTTVNNITELVTQLNTDPTTSYLGTYSEDGSGGVLLEITSNLVNQFCSNGTLTFEVYSD